MKNLKGLPIALIVNFYLLFSSFNSSAQNVGINSTGAPPNVSALLDIDAAPSNNKGLLIPRIPLTGTTSNAPIGAGITTSLLVYNTATVSDVTPGYYYWDGTAWARFNSSAKDKFYLGQDTLGGIVYYIYKNATGTQHGLIVSKTESTAVWQAAATLTGANRTEDGAYNTGLMTSSAAATYVTGLGAGWYLPSIDELGLLYYNRYSAQKALRAGGFTLLSTEAFYWSSTEDNAAFVFSFYFFTGYATTYTKFNTLSVRGVRAF